MAFEEMRDGKETREFIKSVPLRYVATRTGGITWEHGDMNEQAIIESLSPNLATIRLTPDNAGKAYNRRERKRAQISFALWH